MNEAIVIIWALIAAAIECGRRVLIRVRTERDITLLVTHCGKQSLPLSDESGPPVLRSLRRLPARTRRRFFAVGLGTLGGLAGLQLIGPLGLAAGAAVGAIPYTQQRRRARRLDQDLERQLAEVAESTAMAVRSGFSIGQALEFAAEEVPAPMSAVLGRLMQEQRLGTPFEEALRRFADHLGSADTRLFALVLSIHARSGGNLAGALDEVAGTIRHRIAVRRELRALSAQGRISGSILGALPIAFFLVLAATSHHDLAPVYGSPAGIAMISSGLVMEGLAFVWISRILGVEA